MESRDLSSNRYRDRKTMRVYPNSILQLSLACLFSSIIIFIIYNLTGQAKERIGIIVLGGGLLKDGGVPPHVSVRLKKAVDLYYSFSSKLASDPPFIITLSGGTPHKPNPVDPLGFPYKESTSGAKELLTLGVPPERILEEAFSLDTFGNAYWLRQIHVMPAKITKLFIITNDWHMDRTMELFKLVFQQWSYLEHAISLVFVSVEAALEGEVLRLRIEKERRALEGFTREVLPQVTSLSRLHNYMFSQHMAYSTKRLLVPHKSIDPKLLETY